MKVRCRTLYCIACLIFAAIHPVTSQQKDTGLPAYSGAALKTIAFPIGGLAAGNITLGGRGDIHELEIFNRPAKNVSPDMTFFSIRVQQEGGTSVAKILERELLPPYVGWMGFPRNQLAGVSRFDEVTFRGAYPFAELTFQDDDIPLIISLEAFNPFIPLDPERSGIPGAVFNWTVENPTEKPVTVSLAFSMFNPIRSRDGDGNLNLGENINQYVDEGVFRGIRMSSARAKADDLEYGSIAFVTTAKTVDAQTRWYRGGWWDNAHVFWDDFSDDGRLKPLTDTETSAQRSSDVASLSVPFTLEPGEKKTIPFYMTWSFPNRENYWNGEEEVRGKRFRNHYALRFPDAWDAARYLISDIKDLNRDTRAFQNALFSSSFPSYVIDAVSANLSTLKTNVVIWDDQGHFYGWEGLTDNAGCCMGTCTHVWNYEQTLAFLFPSLERSLRETAFLNDTFENGYQTFRTLFPPGGYWWKVHPATDGQMGNIMRVYREWKFSGDTDWLRRLWPRTRAALEFAWKGVGDGEVPDWQRQGAPLPWDPDRDGVMEGQQHNTYDIDFYGPNTMVGSLYLGALKAGAEMAEALGHKRVADEYRKMWTKGAKEYDRLLWNGEYYKQIVDVMEGLQIPDYLQSPVETCEDPECECKQSPGGKKEALTAGEVMPKYQYGEGCLSDQLLGQYLAFVTGLGYLLPQKHVDEALESIHRYNFRERLDSFSNVQRVYALNGEAGLLLCSWPRGGRPALPFVYSDEVWTGIEYQVAASLIYAGKVEEGLDIVRGVRERYRGFDRNPWDELECGHHYARALASWAVLLALSGYEYDGVAEQMTFSPRVRKDDFRTFWSAGSGWGSMSLDDSRMTLDVHYGQLRLRTLGLGNTAASRSIEGISVGGKKVGYTLKKRDGVVQMVFDHQIQLKKEEGLEVRFGR